MKPKCPMCGHEKEINVYFAKRTKRKRPGTPEIWCAGCNNRFHIDFLAKFFPDTALYFALDEVQAR